MSYLPPTFAARPDLSFDFDLFCLDCRYNLRGLTRDARCPECGKPVAAALATDLLYLSDPAWLSRLIRGCSLLLLFVCTPALFVLMVLVREDEAHPLLCPFLAVGLLAVGGWLLTSPEPGRPEAPSASPARLLRRLARGAILFAAASLLVGIFPIRGAAAIACVLVFLLSVVTAVVTLLLQTATLARRLVCTGHARFARGAAAIVVLTLLLLCPAMAAGAFGMEPDHAAILVPSCTAMLLLVFLFPAMLVLFHPVRAYLIAARRYAPYITPAEPPTP
jgi:hypothetical protein